MTEASMEIDRNEPKRFCRKCLIRELGMDEYFRNLQDYIRNLDPDLKVPDEIYEERLAMCKKCEELTQGLCRVCGCYVELRAAMKKNSCPLGKPAWVRAEEGGSRADYD